jgi:small-conductance mechanosensitive channel
MQALQELAGHVYFGNSLERYAEALLIFLVLLTVLRFVRLALSRRLHRLKPHQSPTALELSIALLDRTTRPFIAAVSAYFAIKTLELPPRADHVIDLLITVVFWIQAALWGVQAARFALATQNVLGDILASLAIAWDKPFQLGDELHFGDVVGNVEHIGIRSTRLRSIDGEQIVIGNAQLLTLQIHNFGRASEHRTTLTLTLAFDTPPQTVQAFAALVERVVKALPAVRFDHCVLRGLGASGFDFDVSFFASAPTQTPLIQVRAQFTLQLLAQLHKEGMGFASAGSPVLALGRPPAPEKPGAPQEPAAPDKPGAPSPA